MQGFWRFLIFLKCFKLTQFFIVGTKTAIFNIHEKKNHIIDANVPKGSWHTSPSLISDRHADNNDMNTFLHQNVAKYWWVDVRHIAYVIDVDTSAEHSSGHDGALAANGKTVVDREYERPGLVTLGQEGVCLQDCNQFLNTQGCCVFCLDTQLQRHLLYFKLSPHSSQGR